MNINLIIESFVYWGITNLDLHPQDRLYAINKLLFIFNLSSYKETSLEPLKCDDINYLFDLSYDYCIKNNIIPRDSYYERELMENRIIDTIMPSPYQVRDKFYKLFLISPKKALTYYYNLSVNSGYIKFAKRTKNINWSKNSKYGKLELSINISKPEKSPKEIEKIAMYSKAHLNENRYPKCDLCIENEGFCGNISQSSKINHRIIPITLGNKPWYIQFSPYLYYTGHMIALNKVHKPMIIDDLTFENFIDFIELFPDCFIGSNADLPIVGGSILNHDHYQAGMYNFPLFLAKDRFDFKVNNFEDVKFSIVNWPMTVIRLKSKNKKSIYNACCHILGKWISYKDKSINLINKTETTRHNTITPCAYKLKNEYVFHLALRNNKTSDKLPLGIFHTNPNIHNVKRENIGLIETMGLAILPGRLKNELGKLRDFISKKIPIDEAIKDPLIMFHKNIYEKLDLNSNSIEDDLLDIVSDMFIEALEDCNVFKYDKDDLSLRNFLNNL